MQPTPDPTSPLDTLRQLQAMREAGTLTAQEFEALKQRLVFGVAPDAPAPPAAGYDAPVVPTAPAAPLPYLDSASALTPEATPLLAPEPDWQAAPASGPAPFGSSHDDDDAPEPTAGRRNPLNLVFALGGLLLFLGVMAYLGLRPHPDEHVGSTTLTASDTTEVAAPEGPQTEQLTLPPAAPETLRVAPVAPPPTATTADALPAGTDSTAALPEALPTPAPKAAAPAKTTAAPKPAATKPAAAPAAADSAAGQ